MGETEVEAVDTAPGVWQRRYDVDWLRTLAIGLLIVFHIILSFQFWAESIGFPQNDVLLDELIPLVSFLTVWRIPLLFMISGMGVRFAMERRDWKKLLSDRALRILLPYVFGVFLLGPAMAFGLLSVGWDASYTINFGHLWFLLNIFLYVVWLLGIMIYMKDQPQNRLSRFFSGLIRRGWGLFLFAIPLMLEAWLTNPEYFAVYIDSIHGWLMGLICFFYGFIFISAQEDFWPAVVRIRWVALILAVSLYLVRLLVFEFEPGLNWLTALESMNWMLAIIGFGALYLNRPSRGLSYFSKAVYPVYIVHLPVQFAVSYFLLEQPYPAYFKLFVLLVGTFGFSLFLYEFILKRLKWIRPLFGIKMNAA